MQPGHRYNKSVTSIDGTGLTNSASDPRKVVTPPSIMVSSSGNPHYAGEDDSHSTLSGAGDGDYATSPGKAPERYGYQSSSGSRIEINDSAGAERVELVHHSGAAVVIDPDGGVYVNSTSARGMGLAAPRGDIYISAAGEIILNGGGPVTVRSPGDLTLDVGGTLNIVCGAYKLTTKTVEETVDGSASRSVTNDNSLVVGGIDRTTVAGDRREQVSGLKVVDIAGTLTARIDGETKFDVGDKFTQTAADDITIQTEASAVVKSSEKTTIDAGSDFITKAGALAEVHSGGNMKLLSGAAAEVHSADNMKLLSGGNFEAGAQGDATLSADGTAAVHSPTLADVAAAAVQIGGTSVSVDGGTVDIAGGTTTIGSGSAVTIAAPALNAPEPSVSTGSATPTYIVPGSPTGPSGPTGPDGPDGPEEADTPETNDIVDELTSARKYPEYLGNGVIESANRAASGMGLDTVPEAQEVYDEYSGGNFGNYNPSSSGGSYDFLPDTPINRPDGIVAVPPSAPAPSAHNSGAKVSKYFTLGEFTGAKHSDEIPNDKFEDVVMNHMLLASNVLDPLREKFNDVVITCGYRHGSANHSTGRAADVVCNSRSLTTHAEMARFARDNLPVDQVYLEKNDGGKTHLHLRVAQEGSSGSPRVLSCNDKTCSSPVSGINIEYLVRSGVPFD